MASTQDNPQKSWWSMARSPAGHPLDLPPEKHKPRSKTLNSFFGLKSKKQVPSIAIPDPPLPIQPVPPEYTQSFATRPPSKSISSTRSRTDSTGPRTPSDVQHHSGAARHSLLTLSDADPFASKRSISIISPPPLPSDPTRLSAYSNTSSNEPRQRKYSDHIPVQRSSYASSSGSQHHGPEASYPLSPVSPPPPCVNGFHGKVRNKRSDTSLNGNVVSQPSQVSTNSGSSGTIGSKMSPRPPTRPRGLSDNGVVQRPFVESPNCAMEKPSNSAISKRNSARPPSSRRPSNASPPCASPQTSPRVVIRQASLQTISNPAPPPTQRLPAPPTPFPDAYTQSHTPRLRSNSTASSTLSFSYSALETAFPTPPCSGPRSGRKSDRKLFNTSTPTVDKLASPERAERTLSPRPHAATLKKAVSQQSLRKRNPLLPPTPSSGFTAEPAQDRDWEKDRSIKEKAKPPKLRIFPHPRIPIPPIPANHSNLSGPTLKEPTLPEQKHSSVRKRLFSGSNMRRPSTSHATLAADEDTHSTFSVKSEQDLYINTSFFKPWITAQPSHPSFWDEVSPETAPGSPVKGPGDATVSPTLGRLELPRDAPPTVVASPFPPGKSRQRGLSVRSSSTMASIDGDDETIGPAPRSPTGLQSRFQRSKTLTYPRPSHGDEERGELPFIAASIGRPRTATASSIPERRVPSRPASAQPAPKSGGHYCDAYRENHTTFRSVSPTPAMVSLPPPPRRTRNRQLVSAPEEPSPPPPKPKPKPISVMLAPPPNRAPRPKMSFEKLMHRRSIMKKPSFLEISDDDDDDNDGQQSAGVGNSDGRLEEEEDDMVQLFDDIPRDRAKDDRRLSPCPPAKSPATKPALPRSESFLDFARESFDTTRD